jgi:hypothetical protein
MIPAFPNIFTLGTVYVKDIFLDEVEITEKIDGSQFSFGKINGALHMRSKEAQLYSGAPVSMFKLAMDYIESIQDRIPDNTIFHAEYLSKCKHNTLKYDRVPKNNIILFGARDTTERMYSYVDLGMFAQGFDIEVVPLLYRGMINNVDQLLNYFDTISALGGTKIEGVVVKNYNRTALVGGMVLPLMCGKMVSEEFKEKHGVNWDKNKGVNKLEAFCQSFRTEARWQKAVQHLRDSGQLAEEPSDIGKLIKAVNIDIEAEEEVYIKEWLYREFKGQLLRTATRGLPEWYKEKLLENSTFLEKELDKQR